jgi:MFS transporter, DHA1 family, multidrug resistance protein
MHSEILRPPRLWILALTVSFPAVLAILFTPALPDLALFFQISEASAKTSMTTYLFGYACGMLLYGPLANRWGRKLAMLGGFLLALVATILCLWAGMAKLFWLFCAMRLIQGLGASSGMKISMTMVADTHVGEKATRAVSYLILAATMIGAAGLAAGGTLAEHYGWEGCFVFMSLYSALLMFMIRFLPETAKEIDAGALAIGRIAHDYGRQFKDPFLVLHALITGFCTSCFYFLTTEGPYIGIETMGLSPQAYGWWSWIPVLGMGGGCLIAARLAGRRSPRITMLSGLIIALMGSLIMMICFGNGAITIATFFFLMLIVQMGVYIVSPTSLAIALIDATDKSNASAASQFINFGVSFIAILLLSLIPSNNPIVLPALIAATMVIILFIWIKLKAHHERRSI